MIISCVQCGKEIDLPTGAVNRARALGLNLYCGRACSGLGRRKWKTDAQKKLEKKLYDEQYREKNSESIKTKKKRYFKETYDPKIARIERKKRAHLHAEYCRRPEYKAWKKEYDKKHRAKRYYGEFWECFLISMEIREEALKRNTDYEIRLGKGQVAKSQRRKREHARSYSKKLEIGPLGNLKQGQRR